MGAAIEIRCNNGTTNRLATRAFTLRRRLPLSLGNRIIEPQNRGLGEFPLVDARSSSPGSTVLAGLVVSTKTVYYTQLYTETTYYTIYATDWPKPPCSLQQEHGGARGGSSIAIMILISIIVLFIFSVLNYNFVLPCLQPHRRNKPVQPPITREGFNLMEYT